MAEHDPRPFLVLTVLLDSAARPAAITRCHGDALERSMNATNGKSIAGIDLVELPIAAPVFRALRGPLRVPEEEAGIYDLFPLSTKLDPSLRKVAGQFLAAEALWALDEQGLLGGVPVNIKLDLPKGWDHDPKKVHEKLVAAGALELSPEGVQTYLDVKAAWDRASA